MACNCGCSKIEIGKVCEKVPKCLKFLKLFIGLQYAGQIIDVNFNRKRMSSEVCKKVTETVDLLGYVTINVRTNLPIGFLIRGFYTKYNYKVFIQNQSNERIKLNYKGVEYCSLSFSIGCCDYETLILNP